MANVLFIYERDMATVSETRLCYERMFKNTTTHISFKRVYKTKSADIAWADVLYFIRPANTLSLKIARLASKAGKTVIFFMDDDLFNLPADMPTMPWRQKALRNLLSVSDILNSSSPYIIEKYKNDSAGKRSAILDTAVPTDEVERSLSRISEKIKEEDQKVRIVFAAGGNHEPQFRKFIEPSLSKLSEKYGNRISLSFVGVHPNIASDDYKFEVNFFESLPLLEYRKLMREQDFDIGLSPLNEDEFTKCKYFNKYIEYGMVGIPGIYSNVEPYTYAVRDSENGLLADNNSDSWYKSICRMIDDKRLRLDCAKNALLDLKEHFSDRAIRLSLEEQIPELLQEHREDDRSYYLLFSQIRYRILRLCDLIYLTGFYLKNAGISGVVKRAKAHIIESKNYR